MFDPHFTNNLALFALKRAEARLMIAEQEARHLAYMPDFWAEFHKK